MAPWRYVWPWALGVMAGGAVVDRSDHPVGGRLRRHPTGQRLLLAQHAEVGDATSRRRVRPTARSRNTTPGSWAELRSRVGAIVFESAALPSRRPARPTGRRQRGRPGPGRRPNFYGLDVICAFTLRVSSWVVGQPRSGSSDLRKPPGTSFWVSRPRIGLQTNRLSMWRGELGEGYRCRHSCFRGVISPG